MRQTGGSALGEISTKSNPRLSAKRNASAIENTPGFSMFSPTSLTCGDVISKLVLIPDSSLGLGFLPLFWIGLGVAIALSSS